MCTFIIKIHTDTSTYNAHIHIHTSNAHPTNIQICLHMRTNIYIKESSAAIVVSRMNLHAYELDDCRLICVDMYTCTYIRSGDDVKTERVLREYLDRHKEGERGEGAVAVMFTSTIKALSQVLLNVYRQKICLCISSQLSMLFVCV